ncbi:MAG: hypothetical protein GY862_25330 [Gammaproteobacteria bacterium]|nr:hypothetical protein [Gammaproteobacteria bacterium]
MIFQTRFQNIADALNGTGDFEDGEALVAYPRESNDKYAARQALAWYENLLRPACQRFVGHLLKRRPHRVIDNDLLQDLTLDADWKGNGIDVFWQGFALDLRARGSMLLLVDSPSEEDGDRVAPYLVPVLPENITAFETDISGRFTSLSYSDTETIDDEITDVWRTWTTTVWAVTSPNEDNPKVYATGEHGLGVCPVLAITEMGDFPHIGEFATIADISIPLYNRQSEYEELLRSQTFSVLAYHVPPEMAATFDPALVSATVGTNNMLVYSGDAPSFLTPASTPTQAYIDAIQTLKDSADDISMNIELPTQAESGVALKLRFERLNSALASFAGRMEDFERSVWDVVALWIGIDEHRVEISWPNDYSISDAEVELSIVQQLQASGYPEEVIREVKKHALHSVLPSIENERMGELMESIDEETHERPDDTGEVGDNEG